MEYNCLAGVAVDLPTFEGRNLCSSSPSSESFHHLLQSPRQATSWSIFEPTLLQENENLQLSNTGKLTTDSAGYIGADAARQTSYQLPSTATQQIQFNPPTDMLMTAISGDASSLGGDVSTQSQSMQMRCLSFDEYFNDAMLELTSDSAIRLSWMHTSSSDCMHEADSSCSSERERQSSTCRLAGSSSEESNWRGSDVSRGNYELFLSDIPVDEIRDKTPLIALADVNAHNLSSPVRTSGPAVEIVPVRPCSWMSPAAVEANNNSMISSEALNLDTLPELATVPSQKLSPYKRRRSCYTRDNAHGIPRLPSYNQSLRKGIGKPNLESLMPLWSNVDALHKDFHESPRKQTSYLPKSTADGISSRRDLLPEPHARHRRQSSATSVVPQSVAARLRRMKISERVRILQKLIPGGSKMDTASMLDESTAYVKFLQLQVQLLESLDWSRTGNFMAVPSLHMGKNNKSDDSSADKSSLADLQHSNQAATPLILSEVLQDQLFKHKLCLVSLSRPIGASYMAETYF